LNRNRTLVRKIFLIFSHELTEEQKFDLYKNWQVQEFVTLPAYLQALWSNIPPELESLDVYLTPLFEWLREKALPQDLVLIQGDFGAVYLAVKKAFELGLVPLYATTSREVRETKLADGSIRQERLFKHVRFRVYGR